MVRKGSRLNFKGSNYFRQRLILSVLSGKPIVISEIRSKEDEPGLKEYEINLLRLVDKLTNGMILQVNETGTELSFQPGILIGGTIEHECCKQRAIGYYLEVIFSFAPFFKKGIQITLKGVTNNNVDPTVDSFKNAALPLLKRFTIIDSDLELQVKKRGVEPNGGGEIYFSCPRIKQLKSIQILDSGKIRRIRGSVFSLRVSPAISNRIVQKSKGIFLNFIPDVYLSVDHMTGQKAGKSPGFGVNLVAETTTGVFYTSDLVSKPGEKTLPENIGEKAAHDLLEEIFRGGCVDSAFQSLVCLYMALREKDVSQCLLGPISPYTVQFLRHLRDYFDVTFKLEPYKDAETTHLLNKVIVTCVGVGYNKLT